MPEKPLEHLIRCPAPFAGGVCDSAAFYDWGIVLMTEYHYGGIVAGPNRYDGSAQPCQVKICSRCTTPYIIDNGDLVDISAELGPEDVKAVLARGQATGPHPKIKDP